MAEMAQRFLYIYPQENLAFAQALANVLSPYGGLDVIAWSELKELDLGDYCLVFLDAGILVDPHQPDSLSQMVTMLCQRWPKVKLIIVTASPTWRRAVEALQAGAVDYIRQTLDEDRLHREMEAAIAYYILAQKRDETHHEQKRHLNGR
jgi:DNA-binding NtrC family response regulator